MATWIALLRGINVGGAGRLPMKTLAAALEAKGLKAVRTYIQSGNVVFETPKGRASAHAKTVAAAAAEHLGFSPHVQVLSAGDLAKVAEANPFQDAESEPKSLHLWFLDAPPSAPDLKALEAVASDTERFALDGGVFYLHAPDGIGRSKLAAQLERRLGIKATARNWRTVTTLLDMADAAP